MARSQGRTFARRSPPRQTGWGVGPKSNPLGAISSTFSATGSQLGGLVAVPTIDGITIIRLRGEFLFKLLTATAAGDGFFGAVGVGLFTDAAVAVGVSAIQTPIANEDWDGWMWHRYFSCIAGGQISAAGVSLSGGQAAATAAAVRVEIDSKAMRKIPVGMSLSAVVEVTEDATATGAWWMNSRTLSKLP